MTTFVLIRHARVAIDPEVPADRWRLTPDAWESATRLREDATVSAATSWFSSPEPKAAGTARAAAGVLPVTEVPNLRELDRSSTGWLATADDHIRLVEEIFATPARSVRGCESADAAQKRFLAAMAQIVSEHTSETVAVVSHGIVLTLYFSWLQGLARPDLDLWKRLRLPDLAIVDPVARVVIQNFGASP